MNRNIVLSIIIYGVCAVNGFANGSVKTDGEGCDDVVVDDPRSCDKFNLDPPFECEIFTCEDESEPEVCDKNSNDDACKTVISEDHTGGTVKVTVKGKTNDSQRVQACTIVRIGVASDPGLEFVGWDTSSSDGCPKNLGPENLGCFFLMPEPGKAITCNPLFAPVYTVTSEYSGTGTGTVTGNGSFTADATVTLVATSNAGSTFAGWTPSPCAASFTMPEQDLTCTAQFDKVIEVVPAPVSSTNSTSSGSTVSPATTTTTTTTPVIAGTQTETVTTIGDTQPTSPETVKATSTTTTGTTGTTSTTSIVSNSDSGKDSTTTTSVTETPSANTTKPSSTDSTTSGPTTTTVSPTTSAPATIGGGTNNSPTTGSNAGNTSVTTTSPPNTGGSNENDNQPSSTGTTATTGEYVTPGSSTVSNNQPSGNNEVDSTSPQGGTAETAYGNGDFISGQPFYPGATVDPAYYEGMNSEYVAGSGQSPAYYETQPVSYNNASSTWSSPYANDYADHWAKANPNRSTTLDLGIDPKQWTLTLYPSRNSQLVDNKDGTLTYTANSNFKGVDTFSYSMADSSGQTSVYIVKIQVSADYAGYDYWDFTKDTSGSDYSGNHGNTIYNAWPPATACDLIYAVNDQGVSDSQLLYIDPNQKTTQAFGPILNGYDIEGLEISPYNNRLYAVSSASASKDRRGQLYVVDPNNAELTVIGKTGFDDINALAFRYDGTLWGWAAGKGIVQIDPETARSYVRVPFKRINAEGLAWTSDGRYLYASEGSDLWWWHYGDASEISKKCQNLPGEVEALETLGSGMLMFAIDQDDGHKIYVYDPWDCKIVMDRSFISNYSDIESFAWSTKCEPQPAQLPALENWTGEFKDSAKLNDSECRTKPGWITVEGKVSLTPATSQAFIRSNWQVVNLSSDESAPEVGDGQPACPNAPAPFDIDCVSPHYNSEIISDNFNFKVMAWWPGKPSKANVDMDTVLGTYVSIDILDLKGNSIAGTSKLSRTLWWIESLCDGSNDKPAKTPKVTKIEVVEPEDVNIDSREDKDSPFTNEPLESSKGGAGAAETEVAAEVVGEESKDSKEPTAKDENTDQAAKDNTKPAKVNSDKSSTTAKDKAAKDKVAKDKAAKDKAAKDKAAKDKAAKETKKDQPAAQVKEDKADQATVSDKSPEDKEDKVNSDKADNSAKGDSSNKEDNSAKADNQVDDYAKSEKDSAKDAKTDNAAKADQADKVDKTDKADNTDKVEKTDKTDKADSDSAKSNEKASSTDESTDKITEVDKAKEDKSTEEDKSTKEDKSTEEDKSAKEDKSTGEDKSTKEDKSATDKSKSDSADKRDEGKN